MKNWTVTSSRGTGKRDEISDRKQQLLEASCHVIFKKYRSNHEK